MAVNQMQDSPARATRSRHGLSQSEQVPATLCITEKWIRKRLNLQLDSLEDVRSLALPGSYSEKITHLGRSLLGFTRIKHLDLSRNAIESLEGLDHLKHLETLNLYYNNIANLKELFRLRHNSKLMELDLRLNPVTKNEPDYRLFVVHMLVNLRKLDDRSVRDSERKAALRHFDTDQAYEFEAGKLNVTPPKSRVQIPTSVSKHITSRTELVHSLAARPTALEDDTDELLELIARSDKVLTPSKHSYTKASFLQQSSGQKSPPVLHHSPPFSKHYTLTPFHKADDKHEPTHTKPNGTMYHSWEYDGGCTDYTAKGNFTPAPQTSHTAADGPGQKVQDGLKSGLYPPTAVDQLVEILQRHTSADMSALQTDYSFKSQLTQWLKTYSTSSSGPQHLPSGDRQEWHRLQSEIEALQQQLDFIQQQKDAEIARLQEAVRQRDSEAAVLGKRLQLQTAELEETKQSCSTKEGVQQLLEQANADISALRQLVQTLQEENTSLRNVVDRAPTAEKLSKLEKQIIGLQNEKQAVTMELKGVIERHRQEMESSSQLQDLAAMLQESHRSLVATNDHLLRELEDTKEKHAQEIHQMNMNYEHLRKTIDLMRHV